MQRVGLDVTIFWCPRCGTLTDRGAALVPGLVHRCRAVEESSVTSLEDVASLWERLGISEAIHPEGQRA
jgi:hypothetical protein